MRHFCLRLVILASLDSNDVFSGGAPQTVRVIPRHVFLLVARNRIIIAELRVGKRLVHSCTVGLVDIDQFLDLLIRYSGVFIVCGVADKGLNDPLVVGKLAIVQDMVDYLA